MTEPARTADDTNGENSNGHFSRASAPALRGLALAASELRRLDERLTQRARERPLAAFAAAAAAGYVIGRIFSRFG